MTDIRKKKAGIIIAAAAVVILIIIGLLTRQKTSIDLDHFVNYMLTSPNYYQSMDKIDSTKIPERYGISNSDVFSARVYFDLSVDAREFAVIQSPTAEGADRVQEALSLYCHKLMDQYKDTSPLQFARVQGYGIRRTREYVFLTISDAAGSGNQLVDLYFEEINYDKSR